MNREAVARELVKLAGQIMGPGVPDGTGPMRGTGECPFDDEDEMDEDDIGDVDVFAKTAAGDVLSFSVPLLIRIMEYSKEDAETDMDLHDAVEKMLELGADGEVLTMDDYDAIVGGASGD